MKQPSDEVPVAISYSGGTSSEWMVRAMVYGWLPRPKHLAVFCADTGEEHEWTYERINMVETFCINEGVEFYKCAAPRETLGGHLLSIKSDGRTRADHPPLWLKKQGGGGAGTAQMHTRI